MAPSPLAWLLCLVAFCHLCTLLEGQHLGVTKCNIICHKMTSKIPVALLIRYWPNQESCGRRAIVLETRQHKNFCADPNEKWVQDAMEHLDHLTTATTQNNVKFEKLVNVTSGITPATKGLPPSVLTEPEATEILELTTISQESQRPTGTSQEPPATVTQSSHSTSQAQDAGLATRPQTTEIFEKAAISTTIWQSSAAYQSKSRLQPEDQATGSASTQAPTTLHSTPENAVSKGQTPSPAMSAVSKGQTPSPAMSAVSKGQTPSPALSLRSEETNQAHTDNFQDREPGNTVHPSAAPISSEGIPNPDLVASGSWSPKAEEPIHATAESQKRSVFITPVPDSQAATRRQAVGLLAFLGLLFCLGVAMFAYQSLQGCPRKMAGEMMEGLRYVPRSCGSNSYVLVPV